MKKLFFTRCRTGNYRQGILAAALMTYGLAPGQCTAQTTEQRTHVYNNYDVKNYCIDKLPNSKQQALAGTIFAANGDNSIHLLVTDNDPVAPGITSISRQYDDPGFDERSVGVHFIDQNSIVIVASRTSLGGNANTDIEVLRTDAAGMLQPTFIITDKASMDDLHPTASLVLGDRLYICGYTTAPGTPVPGFRTSKEIFVLSVDLNTNTVDQSRRFDYSYDPAGYDFDMPMRMRKTEHNGNDVIFVGGSCNGYNPAAPGWQNNCSGHYGASLCLVLRPDLSIEADKPFGRFMPPPGGQGGTNALSLGEYSNDLFQDQATGGYFIFGNDYVAKNPQPEPDVEINIITYLDQDFNVPATLNNRYRGPGFDYTWFVSLVEGNMDGKVIMNGIQTSRDGGFPGSPYPTTMANVNPYLAEIVPTYTSGVIDVKVDSWRTILSNFGTGDPSVYTNSYMKLGGFNSSIAFTPATAIRDLSWTKDIFLSAPVWHPGGANKLSVKLIRTDQNGKFDNDCPTASYIPSGSVVNAYQAMDCNPGNSGFAGETFYAEPETDFVPDDYRNCPGDFVFKLPKDQPASDSRAISIAPNPAADQITVSVSSCDEKATLQITLTDMSGRKLAELYHGNAAGINSRPLSLPALATGLYQVTMTQNGQRITTQKLSIR